ncbi:MAG: PaaI family thioesterase [Rhodoferax sp.]
MTTAPLNFDDVTGNPADPVPEGFRPVKVGGPFIAHNGPLYARWTGERLLLGFRVERRHTNPLEMCHGGMLAAFADMLIPITAMYQPDIELRFLPTISLQVDFMGSAPLGSWVQGEAEVLRSTKNMLFGRGLVSADGQPALRISGIFKRGQLIGDGRASDPLGLK